MASVVLASQASQKVRMLQQLHDALGAVQINAQAVAAADLALGTLVSARDMFSPYSIDNARRWAAGKLDEAVNDIQRYRGPFTGMPAAPVAASSWDDLAKAIGRGYNVLWSIQDGPIGTDETEWQALLRWTVDTAVGTIEAMPGIIRDAVHFTAGVATDTVGGVAAGLLPLWPLVVVGGLVLVLGAVALAAARKKGLVA